MSSVGENLNGDIKSNTFPPVQARWLPSRTIVAADWPGSEGKQSLPEIVRLIIEGPVAWVRVPPWAEPLDKEWEARVETWERHDGMYYTLNEFGACYIGVHLVELTPRQLMVARSFGLPASDDEPTLMRWAWIGDEGPRPRAEMEWQDRKVQPKLVDMNCVLPKCIKWQPDCLDGAVKAANGMRDDEELRPTKMERIAGEIRKVNGLTSKT
jgi:hypothetical protein